MTSLIAQIFKTFSKGERLVWIGTAIICLVSGILLALATFNAQTAAAPDDGGSFVEGVVGQPSYINPLLAKNSSPDSDLTSLIFASAVDIAESIKHDKDYRNWTLRIKEGTLWHDGALITSDDVIFSVQTIQNQDTLSPLFSNWQNITVSRISEREVKFELTSPYSLFENILKDLRPVPKKLFADISPAHIKLSSYTFEPIGSGPFMYDYLEKRRDGFITAYALKVNDNYNILGDVPHIKTFIFKFFENEENLMRSYNIGAIDGFGTSNPDQLKDIKLNSTTLKLPTSKYYAIFLNQNADEALSSSLVRLALEKSINKKDLVSQSFNNEASIEHGPIPSTLSYYNPSIESRDSFNIEEAKSLLEQDGWQINSDTNTWSKKQDKNKTLQLGLTIKTTDVYPLNSMALFIKDAWNSIGIKTDIVFIDQKNIAEEIIKTRDYEALLFGNIISPNPDLYSFWHSSQKFYPGLNLALYDSRQADQLIENSRSVDPQSNERQNQLDKLQELIASDAPAIFLASPRYFYVYKHSIPGVYMETINFPEDRFIYVMDWYVKTKRIFK